MIQVTAGVSLPNPNDEFKADFAKLMTAYGERNRSHSKVRTLRDKLRSEHASMVDTIVRCGADPRKIRTREDVVLALQFYEWLVVSVYDLATPRCRRSELRDDDDLAQDVTMKLYKHFMSPCSDFNTAKDMEKYITTSITNRIKDAAVEQAERDAIGRYAGMEELARSSGLNPEHRRVRVKKQKKIKKPIRKRIPSDFATEIIISNAIPANGATD